MTLEEIIILIARIIGSLLVFKWNFFGAIIAILVDFSDLFMMNLLHLGGVRNYQMFDKIIDLFYLIFFLIVTFKWTKKLRNISIFLFVLRIIGFVLFEIFNNRLILFIFPKIELFIFHFFLVVFPVCLELTFLQGKFYFSI